MDLQPGQGDPLPHYSVHFHLRLLRIHVVEKEWLGREEKIATLGYKKTRAKQ